MQVIVMTTFTPINKKNLSIQILNLKTPIHVENLKNVAFVKSCDPRRSKPSNSLSYQYQKGEEG